MRSKRPGQAGQPLYAERHRGDRLVGVFADAEGIQQGEALVPGGIVGAGPQALDRVPAPARVLRAGVGSDQDVLINGLALEQLTVLEGAGDAEPGPGRYAEPGHVDLAGPDLAA